MTPTKAPEDRRANGLDESILRFAGTAYMAVIPLDALPVFGGRSWASVIGLTFIASWLLVKLNELARAGPVTHQKAAGLSIIVVLFMLLLAVKYPMAIDPSLGSARMVTFLALAGSLFATVRAFRSGTRAPLLGLATGMTILSLFMIWQLRAGEQSYAFRATALDLNHNQAASMLAAGALITALLAGEYRTWRRHLLIGAVAMQALGALAAGSKTGLLSLILGAALLPVIATTDRGERLRRLTTASVASLLSLAVVWALSSLLPARLSTTFDSLAAGDYTNREDIWAAAFFYWDYWFPWGVGLGNDVLITGAALGEARDLHNTILWAGVELGAIGAVLVIGFYGATLIGALRSPYRLYVLAGMIPMTVFMLSTSLFHFKLLWALAGLAAVRTSGASVVSGAIRPEPAEPRT